MIPVPWKQQSCQFIQPLNSIHFLGVELDLCPWHEFTLPLLLKTEPSEGSPCFSMVLKFFGPDRIDWEQIAFNREACDSGPQVPNPLVPTATALCPMGVIRPLNGFHE